MHYFQSLIVPAAATFLIAAVGPVVAQVTTQPVVPAAQPAKLVVPPQDQGMPYTRSAHPAALAKLKGYVAVFAGSRYGYVDGRRARLDNADLLGGEAVLRDGRVLVPAVFAGAVETDQVQSDTAPDYLADRWVYTLNLPSVDVPAAARVEVDGKPYIDLASVAESRGLKMTFDPRGLLVIAGTPTTPVWSTPDSVLLDSVVTLFDTPEKFADPDIATKYIPTLARQGKWTDHVKVTAEQHKILDGPETKWPMTPDSKFDLTGFDVTRLGSKVPAPGVYPRILFSVEDLPAIAQRIKSSTLGQKSLIETEYLLRTTWWDPKTEDGKLFAKLSTGNLAGLEWDGGSSPHDQNSFKGLKPGIKTSHSAYVPECLTAMALYCMVTGDEERGRQAAAAIANYWKLREPLIDSYNAESDTELAVETGGNGAVTAWRGMHGLANHMNLGLSLDFSGKWMTADEKDLVRRVIAKATFGRRAYGQDGPIRFRDINWVTWDLPNYIALCAIEGLEGFDRESYESNRRTIRAFCEWGVDPDGVMYESNGKSGGGLQFQLLSMVALARRGENLFGHPNWRKIPDGQVQTTSPDGVVAVSSGTQYARNSQQLLSTTWLLEYRAFFPENRSVDYLLTNAARGDTLLFGMAGFDPAAYKAQLDPKTAKQLRLPSVSLPGFTRALLYDNDYVPTTRDQLDLPLNFNAPSHGMFSAYSDHTTNATWINMMVRPDHYLGAGHHHADAGMFHFSALGVNWITESVYSQTYDGQFHNLVLVDGRSEAETYKQFDFSLGYQAAAKYVGASVGPTGAGATADLTEAYSYRWLGQPSQKWEPEKDKLGWEMEPSPRILQMFAGTSRYKMRPWWSTYTFSNYIATSRTKHNPMQYVYRSVGLVRGDLPYGLVIDDLKKDDQSRLYEWTAMLNVGAWQADVAGLAPNQIALAYVDPPANMKIPYVNGDVKPLIKPKAGDPLVIVCPLGLTETGETELPPVRVQTLRGPDDKKGVATYYDRLTVTRRDTAAKFRVLLLPIRAGEPIPQITWDESTQTAKLALPGGEQSLRFSAGPDQRTRAVVQSVDGKTLLETK